MRQRHPRGVGVQGGRCPPYGPPTVGLADRDGGLRWLPRAQGPKAIHPRPFPEYPHMPGHLYGERVENLGKFPPQIACGSQISIEDNVVIMKTLLVCASTFIHYSFNKYLLRASKCQVPVPTTGLRVKTQRSLSSSGIRSGEGGKQRRRVSKRRWEVVSARERGQSQGRRSSGDGGSQDLRR